MIPSVIVDHVHLAEGRAHLAHSRHQPRRQRSKRQVALFHIYAAFAEGNEKVAAGVGIDDGLQAHLGFVQLKPGDWPHAVAPNGSQEVADHADIGIERLGRGTGSAIDWQRAGLRLSSISRGFWGGGEAGGTGGGFCLGNWGSG
ncbi:MAG: hypothetical protein DMG28_14865 [Acidobacteria bacterium]|nr:MAG: hypothetical protein DMG28_14865 [Acidobacteriota bacterium]